MKKSILLLTLLLTLSSCGIFEADSSSDTFDVEYRALGHAGEFHYILIASASSVKEDLAWRARYMPLHAGSFAAGDRLGVYLGANVPQGSAIVQVLVDGRERARVNLLAGNAAAAAVWILQADGTLLLTDEVLLPD